MESLTAWLGAMGLEKYAAQFAAQAITPDVLPDLTDNDLKELGIAALGDRKRLLKAIAALHSGESAPKTEAPAPDASASVPVPPTHNEAPIQDHAERRQLTLLFCDLVGSTSLSEKLDPEQLRDALRAYQRVCAEAVERYGGYLAQYLGDGILAYFGYPLAHEDDPRRSVHSGLAIIAGIRALSAQIRRDIGMELSVRIGIHTGLAVTGEMGAGEQRERRSAVGEAPNVAARMQSEAAPDTICVSAATERLIRSHFLCDSMGMRPLKGLSAPIEVFRVAGEIAQTLDAPRDAARGAIVGRDPELRQLRERWSSARSGEGHVIAISGEPGIGKSTLTSALREQVIADGCTFRSLHCSPYYTASALYPLVDMIERELAAVAGAEKLSPAQIIERRFNLESPGREMAMSLIAALTGIEPLAHWPAPEFAPDLRKKKTFEALLTWLIADAVRSPVAVVVEDLHWIDASTLEFLGQLLQQVSTAPVFAVFTCRPEFVPTWGLHSHVTTMPLNRLARDQVLAVVERVTRGNRLPAQVLEQIIAKTDGVPLFVEELTRMVLESGLVVEQEGAYVLLAPLPDLAIPTTLLASLTARLDRLGEAKTIAQIGSVHGREFSVALLRESAGLDPATLDRMLDQLVEAEIVFRRGIGGDSQFVFKHALVQGAAYDTMLKSTRQRHHAHVAQVYVTRFPEIAALRPEMVAHHFSRASQAVPAMDYWQRAGELAILRSGYAEAITHFTAALELLETMPASPDHDRRELLIRVKLGPSYQTIKGMGSEEAGRNYSRACEIATRLDHSAESFMGMWGHWLSYALTGQVANASERAEQLVALSQELRDDELVLQAHHARWTTFQALGQLAVTRFDTQQGLRLYERAKHGHHAHIYGGHDPGVCCRVQGGMCAWLSGHPDEADQLAVSGVALARELDHPFSLAIGLWFSSWVKMFRGEPSECMPLAAELLELSRLRSFKSAEPHALVLTGWSRLQSGETEYGLRMMEQGEEKMRAIGQHAWRHFHMSAIAEARAGLGETVQALELVNQAIELAHTTAQGVWRPELLRQRAEWMLALGQVDVVAAKNQLMASIQLAREQSARALELRATASLARVLAGSADAEWAAGMLSDCLATFTEGRGTRDIVAAQALLGALQVARLRQSAGSGNQK